MVRRRVLLRGAIPDGATLDRAVPEGDSSSVEVLARRFATIRADLGVPEGFPPAVLEAAAQAATAALPQRADLTDVPFVTVDPPGSTDLDQALHLRRRGDGFDVDYAIADVPAFVVAGGPIDAEARRRGQTLYAPDRRTPPQPPAPGLRRRPGGGRRRPGGRRPGRAPAGRPARRAGRPAARDRPAPARPGARPRRREPAPARPGDRGRRRPLPGAPGDSWTASASSSPTPSPPACRCPTRCALPLPALPAAMAAVRFEPV